MIKMNRRNKIVEVHFVTSFNLLKIYSMRFFLLILAENKFKLNLGCGLQILRYPNVQDLD